MKKILFLLILVLFLSSCTGSTKLSKTKNFLGYFEDLNGSMVLALNTECYLTTVNQKYNDEMTSKAKEIIYKYHKLLDSHHLYEGISNINTINSERTIYDETGIISDALEYAITISELTEGYFNPTIGKVFNLYDGKFTNFDAILEDPNQEEIKKALKSVVSYQELREYIIINKKENTITLLPYNGEEFIIDIGAISKGYILDATYKTLIKYNSSFMLSAGSSSIVSYKAKNEDINWNIGQKSLDGSSDTIFAYNANNLAISTSGDTEQYYLLEDGTRRSHILDTTTGYSNNYYRIVTLISSDLSYNALLDALSTAIYNIENIDKINHIVEKAEQKYNIDIDYALINNDSVYITERFDDLLIDEYTSEIYTFYLEDIR